jgi:hypothetical protein
MYITPDYIYTIGMCTLLVYSYIVSNTSTTEGKSTTCTPLVYVHCGESNVCTGGLVILTLLQVICTPLVCVHCWYRI